MPVLDVGEMVKSTGGTLIRGEPGARVESFSIDSRSVPPGGCFLALRGSRSDGHDFLGDASARGAAVAIVARDLEPSAPAPPVLLRVESVEAALQRCGARARRKCGSTRFIAVTGSVGKTTTKELIAAGLGSRRRVHRTRGNLNNHLGVPLTLLACPANAEFAVVELGMSAAGEIAALSRLVDPDIGLVTNVTPVHMAFFGSIDDVAAAKGELFATLRHEATSVVNLDDPHVRVQAARHAGPRVTFGRTFGADLVLESVEDRFDPGAALTFRHGEASRTLQLRQVGAHGARDALAALAVVLACGGDLDEAARAMAELEAGPGRGRIHRLPADVVLVDDTYNSSPAALASVLATLKSSRPAGRKILVMGDMLELGNEELAFHREAGRRAAKAGVQILVSVGSLARASLDPARKAGVPETRHEKDSASAARTLPGLLRPGDLVVVKGSRAIGLETVVEALRSASVEASG